MHNSTYHQQKVYSTFCYISSFISSIAWVFSIIRWLTGKNLFETISQRYWMQLIVMLLVGGELLYIYCKSLLPHCNCVEFMFTHREKDKVTTRTLKARMEWNCSWYYYSCNYYVLVIYLWYTVKLMKTVLRENSCNFCGS